VDANLRTLNQRNVGVRVPPTEQLAQLYDQLGHPAQATLAAISRRIRLQLLQHPSVDKLLDLADGDPARAFVVLKYVAAQADTEVRPSEAGLARDAIARLEARFKGQIQAGLNIAAALQIVGVDPHERQALRALLRQRGDAPIPGDDDAGAAGIYGERFAEGLKVMRKALADDIAARVSSMPTPLLRTLLLGLQGCGQLSAVLAGCQALIQRLSVEHDGVTLLQRLLGYAGSGIAAAEILRLGDDLGA
jgi:type III secretion protein W